MASFRYASSDDAEEIFDLFSKAIRNLQALGIDQWDEIYPDRQILSEDIAGRQMYVLTRGGKIAAAVVLNEEQHETYGGAAWSDRDGSPAVIHRLCVDPDLQGQGIGRLTVREAEKLLKSAGYTSVRLDAFTENKSALRLYEKMGYTPTGSADLRKGVFMLYEKLLSEDS